MIIGTVADVASSIAMILVAAPFRDVFASIAQGNSAVWITLA